jgi:hypothetical protein
MTTIDQRILILAAPNIVWEKLSDLSNNVNWQADYQDMAFLSANHQGTHTRWRYRSVDRREYILEITAWYDGLGYEYTIVDGSPYRENRGRIRLQETPEGTVVQWTFSYELGGLFGGIRNAMGLKSRLESLMVESLKTLWQQAKDSAPAQYESKALIREALDYDERSRYKPRHASTKEDEIKAPVSETRPPTDIQEPPIADDDTRPRPAVSVAPVVDEPVNPFARPVVDDEPDFLKRASEETEPRPWLRETFKLETEAPTPAPETPIQPVIDEPVEPVRDARLTEAKTDDADSHALFRPVTAVDPVEEEPVRAVPEPVEPVAEVSEPLEAAAVEEKPVEPVSKPETPAPVVPPLTPEPSTPQPADKLDTATVSIWEVFGIPRPSETQEVRALTDDDLLKASTPEAPRTPISSEPEALVTPEEKAEPVSAVEPVVPVIETILDEARSEPVPVETEPEPVITPDEPETVAEAIVAPLEVQETAEIPAEAAEPEAETVESVVASPAEVMPVVLEPALSAKAREQLRHGLRVQMRRKHVRLRR